MTSSRLYKCQGALDRVAGDLIHQSNGNCSFGVNSLGCKEQLEGGGTPNEPRQTLRATPSGDDAEPRPRMRECGPRSCYPPFAGQSEIQCPAKTITIDRRYSHLRQRLYH